MRAIVACFGNVLRRDDGFGPAVARRLRDVPLPERTDVMEIGIGGIHLVQALLEPVDVLVVVDAVDLNRVPGTVSVIRPDIEDVMTLPLAERHDRLADMHYATPERALMLARGLGVLPDVVWLVGCQGDDADGLGDQLSPPVAAAVDAAAAEVRRLLVAVG